MAATGFPGRTSRRRPAWVTGWCAGAVLAAALAALDAASAVKDVQRQRERLSELTARVQRLTPPTPTTTPALASATAKSDADSIQAAARIEDRLDHPWAQIIGDLEAATPPELQWLVFDHDSDSPQLRLEGTAPDLATVLRVVNTLSSQAGWSDVALTRLQPPDPHAGGPSAANWRFELLAAIEAQRLIAVNPESRR